MDFTQAGVAAIISHIPSTLGTLAVLNSGTTSGCVPVIPIPLSCMDMTLIDPMVYDPTLKTISITPSTFDAFGVAASAQAFSIQRANHTGTQTASTISDFGTASLLAVTWSTITGKPAFTSGTVTSFTLTQPAAGLTITGTGSPITTTGTPTFALANDLAAIEALTGTGLAKRTGTDAWSLDSSVYITGNQTITITGDISGSGATAITATLATVASSGTYTGVTINAKGLVVSGTQISFNNAASLAIQTVAAAANGSQVSATQAACVAYTVPTSTTSTIGGASSVTVVLEICSTNSATAANWSTIGTIQNSQTVTLAVALSVVQVLQQQLCGIIPAGYYRRLRSIITGTGSASTASGQEVLQ